METYLSMSLSNRGKNMYYKDINSINTSNIYIDSFNNHKKEVNKKWSKNVKNVINLMTPLQLALSSWDFYPSNCVDVSMRFDLVPAALIEIQLMI